MTDFFQCPDCSLKFRFQNELDQHINLDHPEFRAEQRTIEDSLLAASRRRRHAPEPYQNH